MLIWCDLAGHDCLTDDLGTAYAGVFSPSWHCCVQPCAGRATGTGERKEWISRWWSLLPLPGCCGACKDGFYAQKPSGEGRERSPMLVWGVNAFLALPVLQRLQSLHSFSLASFSSPPCAKHLHHPWLSMGARRKDIIPTHCPLWAAVRHVHLMLHISKQHLWAFHWGFKNSVGSRKMSGPGCDGNTGWISVKPFTCNDMTKMNSRIGRCTFWQWAPTKKEVFEKGQLETFPSPLFLCQTFLRAI